MKQAGGRQDTIQKPICPLCGKRMKSAIEHYRIDHEIDDVAKFNEQIQTIISVKERQVRFLQFVNELNTRKREGKITAEDYRDAVKKWVEENERRA